MSTGHRLLALPAALAVAVGLTTALTTAPATGALTCDGGSGCQVLGSFQDLQGRLPEGVFGSAAAPAELLSSGSFSPAPSRTETTVTAFAQLERMPSEFSVGGTLAPGSSP